MTMTMMATAMVAAMPKLLYLNAVSMVYSVKVDEA